MTTYYCPICGEEYRYELSAGLCCYNKIKDLIDETSYWIWCEEQLEDEN